MLIATAGHVDHGKTSLVQALTGVDTDRLPEEKARGLTIDLGFAYQTLDDGTLLGFVDVPGHERFIRNMIAGVPAIDFALLVVAADDGPMPQTAEHLAILDLLGVSAGAVVISKVDRVEAERVAQVENDVRALLHGSKLQGVPSFAVSATEDIGIQALSDHLQQVAVDLPVAADDGGLRFAVDRSFSVHGAGLVVTGAVYGGRAGIGDRLRLASDGLEVRVRSMESGGSSVQSAHTGVRCALNLAGRGVDARSVSRGDWVVDAQAGPVTDRIDVMLKVLDSEAAPLKQWTPVHVHHGAAFVTGRVTIPGGGVIQAGSEALAQIVTDKPLCAVFGERIVIRDTSGRRTIGGASVIDPYAPRRVRNRAARLQLLEALRHADSSKALADALVLADEGIDPQMFAYARNIARERVVQSALAAHAIEINTSAGPRLVMPERWQEVQSAVLDGLAKFHLQEPEAVGLTEHELLRQAVIAPMRLLGAAAVSALLRSALIVRDGVNLRLSKHRPKLNEQDDALWQRISEHLTAKAIKPLTAGDLARTLEVPLAQLNDFLEASARRGQLIRVARNRFFHPQAVAYLAQAAHSLGQSSAAEGFNARAYRDATDIGRNLTIDLLEYFDVMGLTRRIGETRKVIGNSEQLFGAVE